MRGAAVAWIDRRTESDTYEPTVQSAQVGLKKLANFNKEFWIALLTSLYWYNVLITVWEYSRYPPIKWEMTVCTSWLIMKHLCVVDVARHHVIIPLRHVSYQFLRELYWLNWRFAGIIWVTGDDPLGGPEGPCYPQLWQGAQKFGHPLPFKVMADQDIIL